MMIVKLTRTGSDLEVGEPRLLFNLPPGVIGTDFSHDGQSVLASIAAAGAQGRSVRVILDWTALVER